MNAKKFFTMVTFLVTASLVLAACEFGLQTPWGFAGITDQQVETAPAAPAAPADDNGDNGYAPAAPADDTPITGVPVADGTRLPDGSAVIVRETSWDTMEVYIWSDLSYDDSLFCGTGFDGNPLHVRDCWTTSTGEGPWPWIANDACTEAKAVTQGSLGQKMTKVVLDGGEVPTVCPAVTVDP